MCEKPSYIYFKELKSNHVIVIGKCGTLGHHRIINEMIVEDAKRISDKAKEE